MDLYLNTSGVRLEILCRIFSGQPALNGIPLGFDLILGHAKRRQSSSLSNLDLGGHQVNPVKQKPPKLSLKLYQLSLLAKTRQVYNLFQDL